MSEELKPCPFCGEEHICLFESYDDNGPCFVVGCVSKDCLGHVATSWHFDTKEEVINAWNTRPTEERAYSEGYEDAVEVCKP